MKKRCYVEPVKSMPVVGDLILYLNDRPLPSALYFLEVLRVDPPSSILTEWSVGTMYWHLEYLKKFQMKVKRIS